MIRLVHILLLLPVLLAACNTKRNPEYLPKATGNPGDIIVIIDSAQWRGPLGEKLREVLQAEVQGLPREETYFNLIPAHPSAKIELLTQIRNLLYVFTLDENAPGSRAIARNFTPESLETIRSDSGFYNTTERDVYSRGQVVMYLFGENEQELIQHMTEHAASIVGFFNNVERERLEQTILNTRSTNELTEFLQKEYDFSMRFPFGYQVADQQNDFVWFRKIERDFDKNVFVGMKPYESEYQMLPDSLIAWRDQIARQYLFGDPANPISYLMTEQEVPFIPVRARQTQVNGQYAMEIRGLWRTYNKSMGGPFVGVSFVDPERGMLYYVEGFVYSPSKAQREPIRELEAIIHTFRPENEPADNP
ncbi:MAG TPA: DUF4837 family protein [Cyclobacteriaceae bacterium]|nr:DUF4837 family protein [Cyclobacteriaceae bacterium]